MHVNIVEKPSKLLLVETCMKKFTLERSPLSVKHVGNCSFSLVILTSTKEFTPKTSPMHVRIVENPSVTPVVVTDMKGATREKSLVEKPISVCVRLLKDSTLERSLMI